MRILIAEDDPASRLILEATVDQLGHEFASAADGEEAWRLFETSHIDAVISDLTMPRMNGVELCRGFAHAQLFNIHTLSFDLEHRQAPNF